MRHSAFAEVIELCGKQPALGRSSQAMAAAAGTGSLEKPVSAPTDATSATKTSLKHRT